MRACDCVSKGGGGECVCVCEREREGGGGWEEGEVAFSISGKSRDTRPDT